MDAQHNDHGDGSHAIHLPDPSAWPIIVGVASLLLGIALVWWTRDESNNFAGPMLGVAIAATFLGVGGWAYEDGRMKKKAEEGTLNTPRDARYTQVVTFAVREGAFDAARAHDGVLGAIEASDLRDREGFQDMRIIAGPATSGPSQVILETTWSGREGLASYDSTRQSVLDTINRFEGQVAPGTVQVFDMQVVRDTKDTSFKFGMGAAITTILGLAVAGFAVGAGLTAFENEALAGTVGPVEPPSSGVVGRDNSFNKKTIEAPPNTAVTIRFDNKGLSKHNLHFYVAKGGATLADGAEGEIVDGGEGYDLTFTTPAVGSYYFVCDVHPDQMSGTFAVKEGVPAPGAPPAPTAAAEGAATTPAK